MRSFPAPITTVVVIVALAAPVASFMIVPQGLYTAILGDNCPCNYQVCECPEVITFDVSPGEYNPSDGSYVVTQLPEPDGRYTIVVADFVTTWNLCNSGKKGCAGIMQTAKIRDIYKFTSCFQMPNGSLPCSAPTDCKKHTMWSYAPDCKNRETPPVTPLVCGDPKDRCPWYTGPLEVACGDTSGPQTASDWPCYHISNSLGNLGLCEVEYDNRFAPALIWHCDEDYLVVAVAAWKATGHLTYNPNRPSCGQNPLGVRCFADDVDVNPPNIACYDQVANSTSALVPGSKVITDEDDCLMAAGHDYGYDPTAAANGIDAHEKPCY